LLHCPVGLRVIYRCEGGLHPDLVIEILKHDSIEILGIVHCYLLRDSITIDDVLPEKFLDGGGGYIGYWLHFNPFGEVLNCDNGEGVVSLGWC
jgi:hypothetical protein